MFISYVILSRYVMKKLCVMQKLLEVLAAKP
jgi:hypothetical protein